MSTERSTEWRSSRTFPGQRWAEWNCHFRDDVRRFWRGDPGMTGAFATRLAGSADLYQRNQETPLNSINFVTSHDGFTLNDLVSYARKHNEANGEGNRDGTDENYSDNNGVEGPSDDPQIEAGSLRPFGEAAFGTEAGPADERHLVAIVAVLVFDR